MKSVTKTATATLLSWTDDDDCRNIVKGLDTRDLPAVVGPVAARQHGLRFLVVLMLRYCFSSNSP